MTDLNDILACAEQEDPRAELWEMVMGLRPTEGRDVNNLFSTPAPGGPCTQIYTRIDDACSALLSRLYVEWDDDIETIHDCWEQICLLVGLQMYQYGTEHKADFL